MMSWKIYSILAGLFVLATSIVVHPGIISFSDAEGYRLSAALCLSDLGSAFSVQIADECRKLESMGNLVLAAKIGWFAGTLLLGLGIWSLLLKRAEKAGRIKNKKR